MRLKYPALLLAAALLAGLAGCAATTATQTASSAVSEEASLAGAASSEKTYMSETDTELTSEEAVALDEGKTFSEASSKKAKRAGAKTVEPLEEYKIIYPMDDGTYAASFDAEDVSATKLTATLYTFDRYEAESIEALKVGDTVRTHTGDGYKTADIEIEELESDEDGVTINGGAEEGGLELAMMEDEELYRTVTEDDYPVYYVVGDIALTINKKAVLSDGSADAETEAEQTTGRDAIVEAIADDEAGWYAENTFIDIVNGRINRINRVWVP